MVYRPHLLYLEYGHEVFGREGLDDFAVYADHQALLPLVFHLNPLPESIYHRVNRSVVFFH